jgi:hypothetical protein
MNEERGRVRRARRVRGGARRGRERGGARLNFAIVLVVIAALVFVGVQYVPAAYRARAFEAYMQDRVNEAALTDKNAAWVEQQLRKGFEDHGVPEDAAVKASVSGTRMEATVTYTESISLLVTDYDYNFDRTVRSATVVTSPN